ncbi:putative O-acetyl-ADP-ribose deacetylase [Dickeya phage vB_DsoM_JA29]|uniref:Putative O-acetyl-ADP-ribose deacetylase n=1 Tax=Dickeya phage vB_DsoM_JA29 TaxID=2283031 RepID=A0A384ZWX9_9CAUD|nr:putative O-acetyl-ADP-ribose deacetylase [Dickeya phage vB_DsoM_JA29]AXG66737.1 putative O-acetyl-ADP-ribose deacetylase [Dickeya phage vB_DsoM_JA29]
MDLSAIGYAAKDFRVIPVHDKSFVRDFLHGEFKVMGIECNARASYNSPIQTRLKSIFPNLAEQMKSVQPNNKLLGTTILSAVNTHSHIQCGLIANMFISTGFGLDRTGKNKSHTPVNRFSEKFLIESFRNLVAQLRRRNINPDRQIAVQRFYGGPGGVEWKKVQDVLDLICEEHRINILAYLPKDYDTQFVSGT